MYDRDVTIKAIRAALKRRSGKTWSVTGGRGTAWGWIKITAPPSRRVDTWTVTEDDARELRELLGLVYMRWENCRTVSVPDSPAYYAEYVARAEGRTPEVTGTPYWD